MFYSGMLSSFRKKRYCRTIVILTYTAIEERVAPVVPSLLLCSIVCGTFLILFYSTQPNCGFI